MMMTMMTRLNTCVYPGEHYRRYRPKYPPLSAARIFVWSTNIWGKQLWQIQRKRKNTGIHYGTSKPIHQITITPNTCGDATTEAKRVSFLLVERENGNYLLSFAFFFDLDCESRWRGVVSKLIQPWRSDQESDCIVRSWYLDWT